MIYTFYSFKGGVGRSMALANVAELLYERGATVLIIDFDLEAPGLEKYFDESNTKCLSQNIHEQRGIVDLLLSYKELRSLPPLKKTKSDESKIPESKSEFHFSVEPLSNFVVKIYDKNDKGGSLSIIPAGSRSGDNFTSYANNVRYFDWDDFYKNWDGELFFEWFRQEVESIADYVLIDSRTGISEMSGVCTYLLADKVIMFVSPNHQNLSGTSMLAESLLNKEFIEKGRNDRSLSLLFVPSRVEHSESDPFNKFSEEFNDLFSKYVNTPLVSKDVFHELKIPYVAAYAYKEKVAVREPREPIGKDLADALTKLTNVLQPDFKANEIFEEAVVSSSDDSKGTNPIELVERAINIWEDLSKSSLELYGLKLANARKFLFEQLDEEDIDNFILAATKATDEYLKLLKIVSFEAQKEINISLSEIAYRLHEKGDEQASETAINILFDCCEFQRNLITEQNKFFNQKSKIVLTENELKSDLAKWLLELSNWFIEKEKYIDGLKSIQESILYYRKLTKSDKRKFASELAESLITNSECLLGVGELNKAHINATRAVWIYKFLHSSFPREYEAGAANSQNVLLDILALGDINKQNGTLSHVKQAVEFFRDLVKPESKRYKADLAKALNLYSDALFKEKETDNAIQSQKESIRLFKEIKSMNSTQFEFEIATSLLSLSKYLSKTSDNDGSINAAKEAEEILEKLIKSNPNSYLEELKEARQIAQQKG